MRKKELVNVIDVYVGLMAFPQITFLETNNCTCTIHT